MTKTLIVDTGVDFILSHKYILYGIILLSIGIILELINGLIDIAVYTAIIGAVILIGYGGFIYLF